MLNIHIIKANFLAGLLSGVIAPVIWPLVVFFTEGKFPTWSAYPLAAVPIFTFTIILGFAGCIIIGIPTLSILEKHNINTPTIAGMSGLIFATIVFFAISVINNYPSLSLTWPLAAFFASIGAFCGFTASALARTNKSLNRIGAPITYKVCSRK